MRRTMAHTELRLDDHRDPGGRPDLADEPAGFRGLGQQGGKLGSLLGRQPRLPPQAGPASEPVAPALFRPRG